MYDSREDTKNHIKQVRVFTDRLAETIIDRGCYHDFSKLREPEKSIFDEFTPKLAETTYGSPEYKKYLSEMKVALDHHYANNRHHPEWADYNEIEYRDIKGFEGKYQISNYGDVKRLAREVIREKQGNFMVKEMILTASITPKGYCRIQLSNDGVKSNFFVHNLVADAFLKEEKNKNQINHIDGNKRNNRLSNLERCNNSENQIHAYKTGLQKIKYAVHCIELNITTMGSGEMERKLKELGYKKARGSSILACVNGDSSHHLGLHFEGSTLAEFKRSQLTSMNLVDLIEMLCDWKAATMRHNDGDIMKSIEFNQERFGYDDGIKQLMINTVNDYLK